MYLLQSLTDFLQMFVAVLFAFKCLNENGKNCKSMLVFAGLFDGLEVCAIPVHEMNLHIRQVELDQFNVRDSNRRSERHLLTSAAKLLPLI